jgi:DNA-binding NtrC family response regulator
LENTLSCKDVILISDNTTNKIKILAIDDHKPILDLYKMALNKYFDITLCQNFKETTMIESKDFFDFIIMDYHMSDISFSKLLNYVKENFKKAKLILITGSIDIKEIQNLYSKYFLAILPKPLSSYAKLKHVIENN